MTKRTPSDPVTQYAAAVVGGEIVAGRLVRLACERHLRDLDRQGTAGLVWKPAEAQAVIDFFAEVLCLPENVSAAEEVDDDAPVEPGQPFLLTPFQQFIAGSLFGWYTKAGFRRFRTAYVETGKGSGKTPFGAGLMIYMLVADGERGAQVYSAAVTLDQAKDYGFRDAERMVEASPALSELIDKKVNNLAVLETGSFFRPISSEKRGLDGKRVHGALIDELHEHPSPLVVNKVRAGTKGRRNALIFEITNSGYDRTSVCWNHHEYSRQLLEGAVSNDAWFAYVCGLDPCESCADKGLMQPAEDCANCDDWRVEGPHWIKANPNLGITIPWQYLREQVTEAIGMPSQANLVQRLNFCMWTQAETRAISMAKWAQCQSSVDEDDLLDATCYGGLDLGQSDDLSAWLRIWPMDDGRVAVKARFWAPRATVDRKPLYQEWEREHVLEVTEGDTVDYATIQDAVERDCQESNVRTLAYDPKFAEQMAQYLRGVGVDAVKTSQGFPLNEPTKRLLELISEGNLCCGANPILSWMAANFVTHNGRNGEIRPDKESAPDKIDGIVALIMAIDQGIVRNAVAGRSVYDADDAEVFAV